MPVSAVTLGMLMDAGLQGQALIAVVASIDADMASMCAAPGPAFEPFAIDVPATATAAKSANAVRQARFRAAQRASQGVTRNVTRNAPCNADVSLSSEVRSGGKDSESLENLDVSGDDGMPILTLDGQAKALRGVTDNVTRNGSPDPPLIKKDPPAPPKEINPPLPPVTSRVISQNSNSKAGKAGGEKVRSVPAEVLDADRVAAVIEHRRVLRKPLTEHAAKMLASRFALMPDPNLAADMMIGNGWQGFEPEWVNNRGKSRAPLERPASEFQQRQDAFGAALDREMKGKDDELSRRHVGPSIELGTTDFRIV